MQIADDRQCTRQCHGWALDDARIPSLFSKMDQQPEEQDNATHGGENHDLAEPVIACPFAEFPVGVRKEP